VSFKFLQLLLQVTKIFYLRLDDWDIIFRTSQNNREDSRLIKRLDTKKKSNAKRTEDFFGKNCTQSHQLHFGGKITKPLKFPYLDNRFIEVAKT